MTETLDDKIANLHNKFKQINSELDKDSDYNMYESKDLMIGYNKENPCKTARFRVKAIENKLYLALKNGNQKENIDDVIDLYFKCRDNINDSENCEYVRGLIDGSNIWEDLKFIANELNIDYRKR